MIDETDPRGEKDTLIFQYCPGYSFSAAASRLHILDPRWGEVAKTQNIINNKILNEFGMVDWCVVKINKITGEITLGNEEDLKKYFPDRNPNQTFAPNIEWPRLILDLAKNYVNNGNRESLKMLQLIGQKYGNDLNKEGYELMYSGSRNEIVVAMAALMARVLSDLHRSILNEFKSKVMNIDELKFTFNQLLCSMAAQAVTDISGVQSIQLGYPFVWEGSNLEKIGVGLGAFGATGITKKANEGFGCTTNPYVLEGKTHLRFKVSKVVEDYLPLSGFQVIFGGGNTSQNGPKVKAKDIKLSTDGYVEVELTDENIKNGVSLADIQFMFAKSGTHVNHVIEDISLVTKGQK